METVTNDLVENEWLHGLVIRNRVVAEVTSTAMPTVVFIARGCSSNKAVLAEENLLCRCQQTRKRQVSLVHPVHFLIQMFFYRCSSAEVF